MATATATVGDDPWNGETNLEHGDTPTPAKGGGARAGVRLILRLASVGVTGVASWIAIGSGVSGPAACALVVAGGIGFALFELAT